MRQGQWWLIGLGLAVGLSLLAAACGPAPTETVSPLATPTVGTGSGEGTVTPDALQEIVGRVQQDLAERLGIPPRTISIVESEAVDWPDASLGCPQPGTAYAQVITPGYRIALSAEGQQYIYHTGGDHFVLCQDNKTGKPGTGESEDATGDLPPELAALVQQAKADLSTRIGTVAGDITLVSAEAVQWRDTSLGCPQPGMNYLMVITPGYLVKLEAGGEIYEYHASAARAVYCDQPAALP